MENSRIQSAFYIGLIAVVIILTYWIFQPYFSILVLALVLGVIFNPVYQKVLKYIKKEFWAALLTTILVFLIVLLPLTFFGWKIFEEAPHLYLVLTCDSSNNTFVDSLLRVFQRNADTAGLSIDLNQYLRSAANSLVEHFGSIFSSIVALIFSFVLVLFSLFFILRDGAALKKAVMSISPFPQNVDQEILEKMEGAINSIIRGQIAIALIQSVLTMIGFAIFGVPNPVLWGSIVVVAAFVPTLGTSLVLLPAIAFLFFTGHTPQAIGLTAWAVLAVSLVDNFLGPYLINRGLKIHPFLILLSVIGAVSAFGPMGIIIGPLVLALLFALIQIRSILKQ